jgi:hypothetical protein
MHPLTAVKRDPTRERKRGKPSTEKRQAEEAAQKKPCGVALLAYQGRPFTNTRKKSGRKSTISQTGICKFQEKNKEIEEQKYTDNTASRTKGESKRRRRKKEKSMPRPITGLPPKAYRHSYPAHATMTLLQTGSK